MSLDDPRKRRLHLGALIVRAPLLFSSEVMKTTTGMAMAAEETAFLASFHSLREIFEKVYGSHDLVLCFNFATFLYF